MYKTKLTRKIKKEKNKLDKKLGKLELFVRGTVYMTLNNDHKRYLVAQQDAMNRYSLALRDRIVEMEKEI